MYLEPFRFLKLFAFVVIYDSLNFHAPLPSSVFGNGFPPETSKPITSLSSEGTMNSYDNLNSYPSAAEIAFQSAPQFGRHGFPKLKELLTKNNPFLQSLNSASNPGSSPLQALLLDKLASNRGNLLDTLNENGAFANNNDFSSSPSSTRQNNGVENSGGKKLPSVEELLAAEGESLDGLMPFGGHGGDDPLKTGEINKEFKSTGSQTQSSNIGEISGKDDDSGITSLPRKRSGKNNRLSGIYPGIQQPRLGGDIFSDGNSAGGSGNHNGLNPIILALLLQRLRHRNSVGVGGFGGGRLFGRKPFAAATFPPSSPLQLFQQQQQSQMVPDINDRRERQVLSDAQFVGSSLIDNNGPPPIVPNGTTTLATSTSLDNHELNSSGTEKFFNSFARSGAIPGSGFEPMEISLRSILDKIQNPSTRNRTPSSALKQEMKSMPSLPKSNYAGGKDFDSLVSSLLLETTSGGGTSSNSLDPANADGISGLLGSSLNPTINTRIRPRPSSPKMLRQPRSRVMMSSVMPMKSSSSNSRRQFFSSTPMKISSTSNMGQVSPSQLIPNSEFTLHFPLSINNVSNSMGLEQQTALFYSILEQQRKLLEILEQQTRINELIQTRAMLIQPPSNRRISTQHPMGDIAIQRPFSPGIGQQPSATGFIVSSSPTKTITTNFPPQLLQRGQQFGVSSKVPFSMQVLRSHNFFTSKQQPQQNPFDGIGTGEDNQGQFIPPTEVRSTPYSIISPFSSALGLPSSIGSGSSQNPLALLPPYPESDAYGIQQQQRSLSFGNADPGGVDAVEQQALLQNLLLQEQQQQNPFQRAQGEPPKSTDYAEDGVPPGLITMQPEDASFSMTPDGSASAQFSPEATRIRMFQQQSSSSSMEDDREMEKVEEKITAGNSTGNDTGDNNDGANKAQSKEDEEGSVSKKSEENIPLPELLTENKNGAEDETVVNDEITPNIESLFDEENLANENDKEATSEGGVESLVPLPSSQTSHLSPNPDLDEEENLSERDQGQMDMKL